jgi:hypothetical protein
VANGRPRRAQFLVDEKMLKRKREKCSTARGMRGAGTYTNELGNLRVGSQLV